MKAIYCGFVFKKLRGLIGEVKKWPPSDGERQDFWIWRHKKDWYLATEEDLKFLNKKID